MENTSPDDNKSDDELLIEFERALRTLPVDENLKDARSILRTYLWRKTGERNASSTVDAIETLSNQGARLPDVAAVLLRSLAVDQLIPSGGVASHLDRSLVSVVELGLPKICELIGVNAKSQTFEKFSKLRSAHSKICELLSPLCFGLGSLDGVLSARQPINAALNHSSVMSYGRVFRVGAIRGIVDRVIQDAQHVLAAKASLLLDVEQLQRTISEGLGGAEENGSFIFYDFLIPFLEQSEGALHSFIASARGRFIAKITLAIPDDDPLPKRYPLHEPGRRIQLRVPMRNSGPGMSIAVTAEMTARSENVVLQEPLVVLGDVLPGDFSLSFDVLILAPLQSFSADLQVEWGQIGVPERETDIFGFTVLAQAANIDWGALEYWHPYGTVPAEGSNFIGRGDVVRNLASRLLHSPMEPLTERCHQSLDYPSSREKMRQTISL